jgi:hypothetical protein
VFFVAVSIILATFALALHTQRAVARPQTNPLAVFLYPDGNISALYPRDIA